MRWAAVILAAAAALVIAAAGSPAARGAQRESLAGRVELLSAKLTVVERRLTGLRRALRRSRTRITRLERRLDEGAGAPASRLRSRDGRFVLDVSDEGIRLRGPGGTIGLTTGAVSLASGSTAVQLTQGRAEVRGTSGLFGFTGTAALTGAAVSLGGTSGCPPVARRGDAVQVQPFGEVLRGTITGGGTGVFAC